MHKISTLLFVSTLSSVLTLSCYQLFVEPDHSSVRDVIIRQPVKSTSVLHRTNQSPTTIPAVTNNSFAAAVEKVKPCVVDIRVKSTNRYDVFFEDEATGSGVLISKDGFIVTNHHVIADKDLFEITLHNKRTYEAFVLGSDESTDIAVLKIKETGNESFPYLSFANSDHVTVGEWALAIGNPFDLTSTVTAGIVSAKGRNIDILEGQFSIESFIQTDAVVNPGNSGGALVNAQGQLIGINTAIVTQSGRYEGYSFAVPSNLAKKVVSDIVEFGRIQRGYLGVTIRDLTNELADKNNMENMNGVLIQNIKRGSSAFKGGLEEGDIIISVDGKDISSAPQLQEQIGIHRPGDELRFIFIRKGQLKTTQISLQDFSNRERNTSQNQQTLPNKNTLLPFLGIAIDEIKEGILIEGIEENSIIDQTNMEPGFIVQSINSQPITDIESFYNILLSGERDIMMEGYYKDFQGTFQYVFKMN